MITNLKGMSELEKSQEPNDVSVSELSALLSDSMRQICLTRDYVGPETLPAIDGWEWYEVAKKIAIVIPDDKWTTQFAARLDKCPVCNSDTGIKLPREGSAYCEDCGWPHEDLEEL